VSTEVPFFSGLSGEGGHNLSHDLWRTMSHKPVHREKFWGSPSPAKSSNRGERKWFFAGGGGPEPFPHQDCIPGQEKEISSLWSSCGSPLLLWEEVLAIIIFLGNSLNMEKVPEGGGRDLLARSYTRRYNNKKKKTPDGFEERREGAALTCEFRQ